ncbi:MAG TPA: Ig-like domain-containing protein [Patescibacteria group bacterium]|nr:Ig-like domain-containing protein [Patescibacteria group bacterium]
MLNIVRAYVHARERAGRPRHSLLPAHAFFCLAVIVSFLTPAALCAGPGTGIATIDPANDVIAGSTGSWLIRYVVAGEDTFTGVIEIVIPDGWSFPQKGDPAVAGYVTVSSPQPLANPIISIAASIVTVDVDTLWSGDTVTVVYGDGSIDTAGYAAAQTVAEGGVTFVVRSDPDDTGAPVELVTGSPSLDVIAAPVERLVFVTTPRAFEAGGLSAVMRVQALDQYDNHAAAAADQGIALFSASPSGSFVPASTVTMAAGTDTVSFHYSDTDAGTDTITVSGSGQEWEAAEQPVTVSPAEASRFSISPWDTSNIAGEYTRFTITVQDEFGNASPVPAAQTIDLLAASGVFYATGDHGAPIPDIGISAGGTAAEVDYRNDTVQDAPGYLLLFDDADGVAPDLGSEFATITIDHAGRNVDSSTVAAEPYEAAADSTEFITVTVTVRDAFGNPVDGIGVELVVSGSPDSNFVSPSGSQNSDIDGKAVFELRSIRTGWKTVQARIDGVLKTDGVDVEFKAGNSFAPASLVTAAPDTVTVSDGAETGTVTVSVRDRYDNLVEGGTVVLNVTGSNNTYVPDPPILYSDENGEASFLVWSTTAEIKQATATIDGDPMPYSVPIVFKAAQSDTGQSTIIASPPAATADGADPVSVTVTARDEFGNSVFRAVVTLNISGDGYDYNPFSITTGTDGVAEFTVTSTKAEEKHIRAVIDGVTKTSGVWVDFVPGDPDPALSQITAAPASAVADGVESVTVDVLVLDTYSNRVSGRDVVLQVTPPTGIDIDPPDATTGANGIASFSVRSTVAGEKTVGATVDGDLIADTETIEFTAGAIDDIIITHDGAATAGESDTVGFDLRDAFGNRVTAFDDAITIYTNSSVLDGNVAWSTWTAQGDLYPAPLDTILYDFSTLDGGRAVLSITAGRAESLIIGARYGGVTAQSATPLVVSPAAADSISLVSGDGQTATVGNAVGEELVVHVEDAYHNAVEDETVTFSVVPPGGSVDTDPGTAENDSTATTDASGQAVCPEWILGTESGVDNNRVRAAISTGGTREVLFTASAEFDSLDSVVFDPPVADVTVGAWRLVTATLRDQYGNQVQGEYLTVRIENVPPYGTLDNDPGHPTTYVSSTVRAGYSDVEGKVYVRYVAPSEAGRQDTVGALHQYLPAENISPGIYTSTVGTATRLSAAVLSGGTSRAGETFSFEVKAVDDNDNLITSNTSHISLSPAGGLFTFSLFPDFSDEITETDLVGGTVTIYGWGQTAGIWTIDVTSPPLGPDAFDVTVLPRESVDHYLITTPPGDVVANKNFAFSAEALDTFSNRVTEANNPIKLRAVEAVDTTVTAGGNFSVSTGFLTAGFYANDAARYDKAEQIRIEVSDTVASIVQCSETITVVSDVAYRLEKHTPDTTGVEAGDTRLLRAQVLDRFENPVSGERVIFLRQAGDGSPEVDTLYTNGSGVAELLYTTGTTAGLNTVRAIILNGIPESLETQLFSVTTVPRSEIDHVTLTLPAGTDYTAGQEFTGEINAYDVYGNLITTDSSTELEPVDEGGSMAFDPPVVTLDHGTSSFTAVDTVKGTNRIAIRRADPPADTLSLPAWTGVTIDNAAADRLLKVSGDGTAVAGGAVELVAAVEDRYGNDVGGEGILFRIDSDLGGSPALTDTSGSSPDDGYVLTGPDGAAACILTTDINVGTNTVIASIQVGDADTFNVQTVAGDIFSYSVTPDGFEYRAGEQFAVGIVGLDENGNQKFDDFSTIVELGSTTGTTWFSQNPVVLQGGSVSVNAAESTAVDDLRITAVTQGGGGSGQSGVIAIRPASPAGEIHFLSVVPDTVTANNIDRSLITTTPVRDTFGNVVEPGNLITVTTSIGRVTSEDADPSTPGTVERATDISGAVRAFVVSGSVGTATVHFESVEGSASGDTAVIFEPRPALSYGGYISPAVVVPGSVVRFECRVQNGSPTGVTLDGSQCTISFGDSPNRYSAQLGGYVFIPGGATDTLVFSPAAVPAGIAGGNYTPLISLSGTDGYGASYGTSFNTSANAITVSLIEITDITARSKIVSRGDAFEVEVKVRNSGGIPVTMNDIVINLSGGIDFTAPTSWNPALPHTLTPGLQQAYTGTVRIDPGSGIGETVVSAEAFADAAGSTVSDFSGPAENDTIRVQSRASIAYVAGTLDPAVVTQGEVYAFAVRLRNDGEAAVILEASGTELAFDDGTDTFTVALGVSRALTGDGTETTLSFPVETVQSSIDPGPHGVRVVLRGTENGALFGDTVMVSDPVLVHTPPDIAYESGTLVPIQVSKGNSVGFSLDLDNTGQAALICNPDSTWLIFGTPPYEYRALLDPDQGITIAPEGSTTLSFESVQIPTMPTGSYVPELKVIGTANRIRYETAPDVDDAITVLEPSDLEINSIVLADSATREPYNRMTADQSRPLACFIAVTNNGDATVRIDALAMRLFLGTSNVTSQYRWTLEDYILGSGTLPGGESDTLFVVLRDDPDPLNSMSTGTVFIEAEIQGVDQSTQATVSAKTDLGQNGVLIVQFPAVPVVARVIASVAQASAGQESDWTVNVAIRNNGGSDIALYLDPDKTDISFEVGGNDVTDEYTITYPASLKQSGTNVLAGGAIDTLHYVIDQTGDTAGMCAVGAGIAGVEINSGRTVSAGSGGVATVEIQSQANLAVVDLIPSQERVTIQQGNTWSIDMVVENTGGSAVTVPGGDTDSTFIMIPGGGGDFVIAKPAGIVEIGRGDSEMLTFTVATTGTIDPGNRLITGGLLGIEINSGRHVYAERTAGDSVLFQSRPEPRYVIEKLDPVRASTGQDISMKLTIASDDPAHAALVLDPDRTSVAFGDGGGGRFEAYLSDLPVRVLNGGSEVELEFEQTTVLPDTGSYAVDIHLAGTENGNDFTADLSSSPDSITIEEAPQLSLIEIGTPASVTRSLQPPWDVIVALKNNGEASLDLDLDPAKTRITIDVYGVGDVTENYSIDYPDYLKHSLTDTLAGGQTDTLVFTINATDAISGRARIDALVTARDINSGQELSYDTKANGGGAYLSIQEPGEPSITQTVIEPDTVTSGQDTEWYATLTVTNAGEAALTLLPDETYIYWDVPLPVPAPPQVFNEAGKGGNTTLLEGETKHLVFAVTPTPEIPGGGDIAIKARIGMTENNRPGTLLEYNTGGVPAAQGAIRIQRPPELRIASLTGEAPRGSFVNTHQRFPLAVSIANTGEAAVRDVEVELSGTGLAAIENPVVTIQRIGGMKTASDTFFAVAGANDGIETFTGLIRTTAVDVNSGQTDIVGYEMPYDGDEEVTIQHPGECVIAAVVPSRAEANAGQTVPYWTIMVNLRNDGGAPVTLAAPPDADDIRFYSDTGAPLGGYITVAPAGFASGRPGRTLAGGEGDSLIYTVERTGDSTGTVTIRARYGWTDDNEPYIEQESAEGDTTILVTEPSGVRIVSTESRAPNTAGNTATVNTGQQFPVYVTVRNTGGDDLEQVAVQLVSDGASATMLDSASAEIAVGSEGNFKFIITASSAPGTEVLTASITRAVSVTTKEEVDPIEAADPTENLVIQTQALLSCGAGITAPQGAVDGTLSTDQIFTITAAVSNAGQAGIDETGTLKISLPGGYLLDPPEPAQKLVRSFAPGQEVSWTVKAPDDPSPSGMITISIDTLPFDVNIADSAAVTVGGRSVGIAVSTEARARIEGCALEIYAPGGAKDNTLSTDQELDVRASLTPSVNAGDVSVELTVPPEFEIEGGATRTIGTGDGSVKTAEWTVTAPVDAAADQVLEITTAGTDRNTGEAIVDPCGDQLSVDVVAKARLDLAASITEPPDAVGGELSVGLAFTVEAVVTNLGVAGVDTDGALLEIVYPEGYSLDGGETDDRKPFQPDAPVRWRLRAPDAPSSLKYIHVRFVEPYARDENTDTTAVIETEEITIGVITQSGEISMRNVSAEDTIPPYVAPQGARGVAVLKIHWKNNSAYAVGLDTLYVGVVNDRGGHLDPPSKRVESVILDADGEIYAAAAGTGNPVPIVIPADRRYTLLSGETRTVHVRVDIATGAPAGEMRINIAENGHVVFSIMDDPGTGAGVSWEQGEDFMSGPLSVMSGDFEEYAHNYPNPFRAGSESTRISYFLTQDTNVRIDIYDLMGVHVWSKDIAAGEPGGAGAEGGTACDVEWDGRNGNGEVVRNGVYICRIQAGSKSATFKIAVAK